MKITWSIAILFTFVFSFSSLSLAQAGKRVGKAHASKYFQNNKTEEAETAEVIRSPAAASDHYLMLGFGRMMSSDAWDWGRSGKETSVGGNGLTVTYRMGEWTNSMDLHLRIDYTEYDPSGHKATKLSFVPMITFPDASSRFPLYFGGGIGLGVFFTQVPEESPLALDYQLVIGARFFDVFENTGFFIETGLKNHLLLTSSGQLNGTFLSGGAVFTF